MSRFTVDSVNPDAMTSRRAIFCIDTVTSTSDRVTALISISADRPSALIKVVEERKGRRFEDL